MKSNKSLFAFIGGALVGAAAALLLAPDSGANIRRRIKEKAHQGYESLKQRCDCHKEEAASSGNGE